MTPEEFSVNYPIGTRVRYYPVKGDPECVLTTIRSEAWALGHGAVVVKVNGRAGGVLIDHIEAVND